MLALEHDTIVEKLSFKWVTQAEIADEIGPEFQNEAIYMHTFNTATIVM